MLIESGEEMKTLFIAAMLLIVTTVNAHAYLDPGTGSIILQGLAAGAIAIAIFWRRFLSFVKGLFGKNKSSVNSESNISVNSESNISDN